MQSGCKPSSLILKYEARYRGRIGFFASNLTTGKFVAYRENESFGTASIIKVPLLMTYFRKCQEQIFDLSDTVSKKDKYIIDLPSENGVFKYFPDGTKVPVRLLAMLMIGMSDNSATNVFLTDFIKQGEFNRTMQKLGYKSTKLAVNRLSAKLFNSATTDIGFSTPQEASTILADIIDKKTLTGYYAEEILRYMSMTSAGTRLTRKVPFRPSFKAKITRYGSKSGSYSKLNIINDLAFFTTTGGQTIVMSCMLNLQNKDGLSTEAVDSMQNLLLGKIGEMAFRQLFEK